MKARLLQTFRSLETGKMVLTLEVDSTPDLEAIKDRDLRLELTQWRERRSLNANAYFHVLCGKIAERAAESVTEAKNQLISDYGQPERTEHGIMTVTMLDAIPWQRVEGIHLRPTTATRTMDDGRLYRVYLVMRGSHTYDTAEMSRLIDGTVNEAKELGIETLTPAELERMKANWRASSNRENTASSAAAQTA